MIDSRLSLAFALLALACTSTEEPAPSAGNAGSGSGSGAGPSGGGSAGSDAGGSAGAGLGASASGGLPAGGSAGSAGSLGTSGSGGSGGMVAPGTALLERIRVSDVTVPEGVKEGVDNWRIWGSHPLHVSPVYVSPLASCETLVCFTTDSGGTLTARVARLDANDALVGAVLELGAGLECRGVAGGPAGQFAALLWDDATDRIFVRSFDLSGVPGLDTELVNADNTPDDFGIGESRFEFGSGRYGAYYHVHSTSGHEGDTLKWVDAASGAEDTEWDWGCSHSMSNALRYHPTLDQFTSSCVTDCYPGTGDGDFADVSIGGLYMDNGDSKVIDMDAGCNGSMAGELGTLALAPNGFKVVFNGHQAPATLGQESYDEGTMNQDIGFSSMAGDLSPSAVVWLTNTPELDEADSSIVAFVPNGESAETYLVGWSEPGDTMVYKLGRVDAAGTFVEGPIDASAAAQWGRRDDPFRAHTNGDAIWAWFDDPGSTTLHVARALSGNACTP